MCIINYLTSFNGFVVNEGFFFIIEENDLQKIRNFNLECHLYNVAASLIVVNERSGSTFHTILLIWRDSRYVGTPFSKFDWIKTHYCITILFFFVGGNWYTVEHITCCLLYYFMRLVKRQCIYKATYCWWSWTHQHECTWYR